MTTRLLIGDCRQRLAELNDESVHCIVTSPPYYGLRDYGVAGQIGLEATPEAYVAELVAVFRECRRVLRPDGTLWLNLGDSYASSQANGGQHDFSTSGLKKDGRSEESRVRTLTENAKELSRVQPKRRIEHGLKPKDLIGIPWMVAFALRADGWWLRQDIIWAKPNPMPESVTDRCTKAHEYLFLLSKSERYFYDAEAIAETSLRAGEIPGGSIKVGSTPYPTLGKQNLDRAAIIPVGDTRNRRSVWTVASQPFADAHFATFPPALIEPCIFAGSPKGGMILDPFAGAGTTGLVADRLQRSAILIELNPAYAGMAGRRIEDDAPLFAEVMEAAE